MTSSQMAPDEPTTETLRLEQLRREQAEIKRAREADQPAEERAAGRRAEKAAYLRSKLDEQASNPDEPR
ncbi:MAG TPA: hypothetical protein VMY78_07335 [Solirubrobacteraceae bacterium]|nr:hypothetical protein [Solirubrobacteraceae bacterium]